MDELDIIQPEENTESAEVGETTERVEEQALEDATHEPGARLEQAGDFEQAEAVEGALTEAVEHTEQQAESPGTQPESAAKPDEQVSQVGDPRTGKGYGQQSQDSSEGTASEEPAIADAGAPSGNTEAQAQTEGIVPEQAVEQPVGNRDVDPGLIDGNEPVTRLGDQDYDPSGEFSEGVSEPLEGTGQIGPQRFGDGNLPEELLTIEEGPGMAGPKTGGKKKPGTPPKSGGGAPAGQYGGGSKGEGGGYHSYDSTEGKWLAFKSQDNGTPGSVAEPDGKGVWEQDSSGDWWYWTYEDYQVVDPENPPQGDPIEGDTPMPYTGSHGGGENPDPDEPVGGLDREAGAFFPVYGKGSGSDSGGGTPGDKDGDDDSGKFLADGELSGGDGLQRSRSGQYRIEERYQSSVGVVNLIRIFAFLGVILSEAKDLHHSSRRDSSPLAIGAPAAMTVIVENFHMTVKLCCRDVIRGVSTLLSPQLQSHSHLH